MTELVESETDVLIVGAGPTGLTLAIELERRGIDCRILEKDASSIETSRALTIQPRTLQLFEDIGVLDAVRAEGVVIDGMTGYSDGKQLFRLRADSVDSPYPYLLHLAQNRTERILVDRLEELGGEVEFERELVGFGQGREGVTATVAHTNAGSDGKGEGNDSGRTETITARWMVGADGGHSRVRSTLGLELEGVIQTQEFLVADAAIEWDWPATEAGAWFHDEGALAAFPMGPDERRWRLFVEITAYPDAEKPDTSVATLERLVRERTGKVETTIRETTWTSELGINQRMVARYRHGRVLLAGDAAHVHSPLGGVGMNTGIQDAYNVGWKLALVVGKRAPEALLDSYAEERMPVAEDVLAGTGTPLALLSATNPVVKALRNGVLAHALKSTWVQSRILRADTQLDISYPGSSLSALHVESPLAGLTSASSWLDGARRAWRAPKTGERAPNGDLRRLAGERTTLFGELGGTSGFSLVLFAGTTADTVGDPPLETAAKIEALTGGLVRSYLVVPDESMVSDREPENPTTSDLTVLLDRNGTLHERYDAAIPSAYLLRPDGYVGFRSRPARGGPLIEYLDERLSLPTTAWQVPSGETERRRHHEAGREFERSTSGESKRRGRSEPEDAVASRQRTTRRNG